MRSSVIVRKSYKDGATIAVMKPFRIREFLLLLAILAAMIALERLFFPARFPAYVLLVSAGLVGFVVFECLLKRR